MDEIEMLCDHIAIMDKGKVIASGTKEEIKSYITTGDYISMVIPSLPKEIMKQLQTLPNIISLEYKGDQLKIKCQKNDNNLISIINFMNEKNLVATKIHAELPTLNDVFLEITGKELRDN